MDILLCKSLDDAIVAYIVKKWSSISPEPLGRTIIQKICYFLKSKGVPLDYSFDIYHYGPYSQDLYVKMDDMVADSIVEDISNDTARSNYIPGINVDNMISMFSKDIDDFAPVINNVIKLFGEFKPYELELLATTHYFQTSYVNFYGKEPSKEYVIQKVIAAKKDKFSHLQISTTYDALKSSGLFEWRSNQ